jgi:ABC-type phosphate/phosphonate transport system substrate-binding protein
MKLWIGTITCVVAMALAGNPAGTAVAADQERELTVVVMDPLAAPLSCPCVKGYAQRDYDQLGTYLERELDRPVKVHYNESLTAALEHKTAGRADLVIGKRSVVLAEVARGKLKFKSILALSGKDGVATQTGLIVVPAGDPAQTVADLKNYRIIFGPEYCDEKYAAALELLKASGVKPPETLETCEACSDGATTILELGANVRAATVISSYAAPLLEGCGTIKKGDLRVVGTTKPVPFVTAFISSRLSQKDQAAIKTALLGVAQEPVLRLALETKSGFVEEPAAAPAATTPAESPKTTDAGQKKSR